MKLDEHLYIALLLRNLPANFGPLATNLRHRDEISFDIAIDAIESEAKALIDPRVNSNNHDSALVVSSLFCRECKKNGHTKNDCWKLHPDKAPSCDHCGGRGHWSTNCRKKKAEEQTCCVTTEEEAYVL